MGVDLQFPLIKNNNLFGFTTSHSINSSKSGMCLNRLVKHGPISSDLINRRLGLNVLTNITSVETKRLIRRVTYTILKIFDKSKQEITTIGCLRRPADSNSCKK